VERRKPEPEHAMTATYWLEADNDEADNLGTDAEVCQDECGEYRRPACGGYEELDDGYQVQNIGCPGCDLCMVGADDDYPGP
jgi:hypothetical protein